MPTRDEDTPHRPWGRFHVLRTGDRHKVKTLHILPGQRTSLQSHRHRREVWVVLEGKALIFVNGKTFSALQGQTVHVGYGEVHRIENPLSEELVIAEVQIGSQCREDDITRYEDDYGRQLQERARSAVGEGLRAQLSPSALPYE